MAYYYPCRYAQTENPYPAHQHTSYQYQQQHYHPHQTYYNPATFCDFQFSSGVPTFPTSSGPSLLTPTTLANLEQTFNIAAQNQDTEQAESGFVTPVVDPIVIDPLVATADMGVKREFDPSWDDDLSSCSSRDPEWSPSSKRVKAEQTSVSNIDPDTYLMTNSRRPTGPRRDRGNERVSFFKNMHL